MFLLRGETVWTHEALCAVVGGYTYFTICTRAGWLGRCSAHSSMHRQIRGGRRAGRREEPTIVSCHVISYHAMP